MCRSDYVRARRMPCANPRPYLLHHRYCASVFVLFVLFLSKPSPLTNAERLAHNSAQWFAREAGVYQQSLLTQGFINSESRLIPDPSALPQALCNSSRTQYVAAGTLQFWPNRVRLGQPRSQALSLWLESRIRYVWAGSGMVWSSHTFQIL